MPSKSLFIIRVALITGVFLFAGVAAMQRSGGAVPTLAFPEALPLSTMRYLLWALIAASAAGVLLLRTRIETAPPQQRKTLTLVGWMFGEGVALFGIIIYFAGGPVTTVALGLLAFVFALLILPVPRERS
jgi:FtsH-binding integral membrane protein